MSTPLPSLTDVTVAIRWNRRSTTSTGDLDLSAFLLTPDDRVPSDTGFVFFNNLLSPDGSSRLTVADDADAAEAERLTIDLSKVPSSIVSIVVAVTMYDGAGVFGDLDGARITVADASIGAVADFELGSSFPTSQALVYGIVVRDGARWTFRAAGRQYPDLLAIAKEFGVNV